MRSPSAGIIMLTCEYPPFPGGIGTYAGRLVDAVKSRGFQATVIAPDYPDLPPLPSQPGEHRILGHHRISPNAAIRAVLILRRTPKDRLFLAADIRSVLLAYALRPLHRRPYRAMIHGSEVSKFKSGSLLFWLVRRAYAAAEMIVANSRATLEIFSANFGQPRHGVVTYLGVESIWFEPAEGGFEHPELAALPDDATVICAVGRIEPRKGQLETVRAIARARDAYGLREPVFVMAGRPEDDAYAAGVMEEAARLGLTTVATGRLSDDDLRRLYRRATVHTLFARNLPGKLEGFGLVLLEAGAQACPSVAAAVGGIPEVLGETGILVGSEDHDGFANAIADYAANPSLRLKAGVASRERARGFHWDGCARETFPELQWDDRG